MRVFAFDLAKELGWPNVDTMLASIPLPLFFEWLEYAKRKPFGEERADLRAAIIACTMANAWSAKGRTFQPRDFMPKFDGHSGTAKQTPEQMRDLLKGIAALHKQTAQKISDAHSSKPSS